MKLCRHIFATLIVAILMAVCIALFPTETQAASVDALVFDAWGNGYEVVDCDETATGTIEIPATYNGRRVAIIDYRAFADCHRLTNIIIPDSVEYIQDYAFKDCINLVNVVLPNDIREIRQGTFSGCSGLENITIPDSVTSIAAYAFHRCESLKKVTIPDSVRSIGSRAFSICKELNSVILPQNITEIGDGTFYWCSSLTSIRIPDGVTKIGEDAFSYSGLSEIMIPDSVTWIKRHAFYACEVENVYYAGSREQWEQIDIGDSNGSLVYANIHYDWNCNNGHRYDNSCDTSCNVCGETRHITHSYKTTTTKATLSKNGSIVKKCTVCGKVASSTTIARPTTFTLSTVNYTYNGVVKTPGVTVKDANGNTLVKGTDYTVTYPSGRTALGSYNVTITMKGNYSGTKTLTFNIKLATPTVKVSNAVNGVKITWNKVAGAKNYKVYKSVYSGGKWSSWEAIKTGYTGTSYTDTTVKSADNVRYTVRAFNGSNSSTFKSSNSIKFLATPTVTATNAAKGVSITWNKITGAKSYIVYKSIYTNGGWSSWSRVATDVTGTSYTDTTVKSGHNVRYAVKAINGNFTSYIKASNSIKFLATPTVKVAKTTTGIKASWNAVGSAKGYIVYRRTYSGGKWSGWTAIKTTTALSFTDTTAKTGVYYQYTVRAYNGNFKSWFVNSTSIKR